MEAGASQPSAAQVRKAAPGAVSGAPGDSAKEPGPRTAGAAEARELFAHPGVDWRTLALTALMWAGLLGNLAWFLADGRPALILVHVLVALVFLNMSFTVWHEGVHGTVFRARLGNDVVGILGTLPVMIPYFMIRGVHHLHHEFTNDPERDPDFWFTRAPFLSLPLRYLGGIRQARAKYLATSPPRWERWGNRAMSLSILALLALAVWQGAGWAILWVWIVPRLFITGIHAWYVNYLPHRRLPAERYRDTRIFPIDWLNPVMLFHNYHGLHHAWQTVPWHRYAKAFRAKREFLEERGAPVRKGLFDL